MRIIAYDRVSTLTQSEGIAPEQHHARLRMAGAQEIYFDVESGFSKKSQLPNLEKVMQMVRDRSVDKVIVTRLDRICRRLSRLSSVLEVFEENNVALTSLEESIDLSTPSGRMSARLLAVFAEHHSDQKSESLKAARKYLRDNARACVSVFGYVIDPVTRVHDWDYSAIALPNGGEIQRIELAKELIETWLHAQGLRSTLAIINKKYGFEAISNGQGKTPTHNGFYMSHQGLAEWLTNPVLRGHQPHRKSGIVHYNTHPDKAILTAELYQEIVQTLKFNQQFKQGSVNMKHHALSGLIYCDRCGSNMWVTTGKTTKTTVGYNFYYRCPKHNSGACPGSVVSLKKGRDRRTGIRVEVLKEAIIEALTKKAEQIAELAATPSKKVEPPELQQLRSQLAGLQALGTNQAIELAIAELKRQIKNFEARLDEQQEYHVVDRQMLISVFSDPLYFKSLNLEGQRRVFHGLVEKVLVRDGVIVEIRLKV